jgi:hypothetical protein
MAFQGSCVCLFCSLTSERVSLYPLLAAVSPWTALVHDLALPVYACGVFLFYFIFNFFLLVDWTVTVNGQFYSCTREGKCVRKTGLQNLIIRVRRCWCSATSVYCLLNQCRYHFY